jgi:ATP-dependent Lhr-like helicase
VSEGLLDRNPGPAGPFFLNLSSGYAEQQRIASSPEGSSAQLPFSTGSPGMPLAGFHPIVATWFADRFGEPTEPQRRGWPAIAAGSHTLIAAPTGSGKTLAGFLACIDQLVRQAIDGVLTDETQVVYVSPLKALSNDIHRNLQSPLEEIQQRAAEAGLELPPLRCVVRTGDTPQSERQAMLRRPPHIVVTTPESLYLMLTAERSRALLVNVRTVIVDEIHALARDKRGSHLALSLERLCALSSRPVTRIGLSATQRPIDAIARFLVGGSTGPAPAGPIVEDAPLRDAVGGAARAQTSEAQASESSTPESQTLESRTPDVLTTDVQKPNGETSHLQTPNARASEVLVPEIGEPACQIIDVGHVRDLDLGVEVPPSELSAVCSHEQWDEVYQRLTELIQAHRSTLVFVNTRRLAERVAHHLGELLGEDAVASHHGSLARQTRLNAEQRLKQGQLKAIVATSSLELGIDVGYIDLVCQIGSPRSIASLLQRVGRSGHCLGLQPKGRLLPLTRDDLIESLAMIRAVRRGELDAIEIPPAPLDILAQQIVAEVACQHWDETQLFDLFRGAWPFRNLTRSTFNRVVEMLAEGFSRQGRRGALIHRDTLAGQLRARRSSRLTAITNGGAIPEVADYRVVTEDERVFVGTVNEDFAIESSGGDIFLLGNTSWQICYVRGGEVVVRDAHAAPATVPFWLGEAPGRTIELSAEVSRLRQDLADAADDPQAVEGLMQQCGADRWAAQQASEYVKTQLEATGCIPTQRRVMFERFFDESGGMQLVIHAPFGARVNRAWGLAMRKRFCRTFNFELQASADDNGVVLSLGQQHSFPIEDMFQMLTSANAQSLLEQALLAAPIFQTRWRWNATRALAISRFRGGKKVPPPIQRMRADDLLSAVFPLQTACLENIVGDLEVPDHPLVTQTVEDCLYEAMDLPRFLQLLRDAESGQVEFVARDSREPSPFSYELLNANPYAFLDDAPLEERRARAVATRRSLNGDQLRELGRLDEAAIAQVRREAWPLVRDADELHDALAWMVVLNPHAGRPWKLHFETLLRESRACVVHRPGQPPLWIATVRWPVVHAIWPDATCEPVVNLPTELQQPQDADNALIEMIRGQMDVRGPVTAADLAKELGLELSRLDAAMLTLEAEGMVLRGRFTQSAVDAPDGMPHEALEWCQRRLLARIHRLTLEGARNRVRPVDPATFLRFLVTHHRLTPDDRRRGLHGTAEAIAQLEGFELAAGAWEHDILPSRVDDYEPQWLDELVLSGEAVWGRLQPPRRSDDSGGGFHGLHRGVPLSLLKREDLAWLLPPQRVAGPESASGTAQQVHEALARHGALFFRDLQQATVLLKTQLEEALAELAALGLVTADRFLPIRRRVAPSKHATSRASSVSHVSSASSAMSAASALSRRASRNRNRTGRRTGRGAETTAPEAARWSRFPGFVPPDAAEDRVSRWARLLLDRWGVVFRDLLVREPLAPSWSELRREYRLLEMRGEIRGGRFVAGVGGEQFADPAAVEQLRRVRETQPEGRWLVLSATDPLNLFGIVAPPHRVPAVRTNSIAIRDGQLLASREGSQIVFHQEISLDEQQAVTRALRQSAQVRRASEAQPAPIAAGSGSSGASPHAGLPPFEPWTPKPR